MYNRYSPSPDGTFQRTVICDAPEAPAISPPTKLPPAPEEQAKPAAKVPSPAPLPQEIPCAREERPLRKLLPQRIDAGDLLVLLILILLLMETDEDDTLTLLLTFAAVMLL